MAPRPARSGAFTYGPASATGSALLPYGQRGHLAHAQPEVIETLFSSCSVAPKVVRQPDRKSDNAQRRIGVTARRKHRASREIQIGDAVSPAVLVHHAVGRIF